jgi:hypothetical protein
MKTRILLTAVILLVITNMAQAQAQAPGPELHGFVDLTFSSKYVWRGFDIYDDKSAIHPSADLNYGGLGINVTGHRANSGEFENGERWDYSLYYMGALNMDQSYALQYRLGWVYYNYPDQPTEGNRAPGTQNAALQELYGVVSLPKIIPGGLVPSYVLVKLWPHDSGSYSGSRTTTPYVPALDGTASGFAHIFMLDYALTMGGIMPETPEQVLNLHSEVVFNDGVGPAGQNVDHDWTNAVFGVSTDFDVAENVSITPGLYYQITMDDSVNDDKDELWVSVGAKYKF